MQFQHILSVSLQLYLKRNHINSLTLTYLRETRSFPRLNPMTERSLELIWSLINDILDTNFMIRNYGRFNSGLVHHQHCVRFTTHPLLK